MRRVFSLKDKYEKKNGVVLLNGVQALVRVSLDQRRRDAQAGLKTAGVFSGYRGSPLASVDTEIKRAKEILEANDVRLSPGVNEELGATILWGTQKVGLAGESEYDGVFGMWYAKAPGVDRSCDALKQANAAGTARHGGVLALCGDDLSAKSTVFPSSSEFALTHCEVPFFNPSDLQDLYDLALHGIQASRFSANWWGLICEAGVLDSSGLVTVGSDFHVPPPPDDPRAKAELNRALSLGSRIETETLLRHVRIPAAIDYARSLGLDGIRLGREDADIGFVATGRAYTDLRQALNMLGILDDLTAAAAGVAVYKVAMPWPLDAVPLERFARGKRRLVVVEHKRAFVETQVRDALYSIESRPQEIWGKKGSDGRPFLNDTMEMSVVPDITGAVLAAGNDVVGNPVWDNARRLGGEVTAKVFHAKDAAAPAQRKAFFCSGCPHATSTRVPDKARAFPGIGCHIMVENSPGRSTDGVIAMGGEGATWVGESPFCSSSQHAFVNMGDGTYHHSGILAIRQALATQTNVTFKILFNDAVAMTGGQRVDGDLHPASIASQLLAEGVEKVVVVSDEPDRYPADLFPKSVRPVRHRDDLPLIQADLAATRGVTVIVYDQVCAAEKRRRRKREAPREKKRLFINKRVCEGCGDCSVQSNCISIEPVETTFGQKRRINQSTCNEDYSCAKGFCPSFAWVREDKMLKATRDEDIMLRITQAAGEKLWEPTGAKNCVYEEHNTLITGIGGFGVTTTCAVLATAGHLQGLKGVTTLDVTGLAQKNGPVKSHIRLARSKKIEDGPHIPVRRLNTLLAADMIVACEAESLAVLDPQGTMTFANTTLQSTADMAAGIRTPAPQSKDVLTSTISGESSSFVGMDAVGVAERAFGDSIFANFLLVGAAYQSGGLPMLSSSAIEEAIALNGAQVERNTAAFRLGRLYIVDPTALGDLTGEVPVKKSVEMLAKDLEQYQDVAYANVFRGAVAKISNKELADTVASSLYRVMAYKDEYEVARLYSSPEYAVELKAAGFQPAEILLAPPIISPIDRATGKPTKLKFNASWLLPALQILAKFKFLRGTLFDPFSFFEERRQERLAIETALQDVDIMCANADADHNLLLALAKVPDKIRGFGHVKAANRRAALKERDAIVAKILKEPETPPRMKKVRANGGQKINVGVRRRNVQRAIHANITTPKEED